METEKKNQPPHNQNKNIIGQDTSVTFRCTSHCYQDTSVFVSNKHRSSWLKFSLNKNKTVMGSAKRKYTGKTSSLSNYTRSDY